VYETAPSLGYFNLFIAFEFFTSLSVFYSNSLMQSQAFVFNNLTHEELIFIY
jgi:hypothetical protein